MKNLYIIGNPVKHSLSPLIFNVWLKSHSLEYSYKKILMNKKTFGRDFKKLINKKNFFGANITIPFKEDVSQYVDFQDKPSKKIGAINCVYIKKNKTFGTNTDWLGYLNLIKKQNKKNKIKKNYALILGFGGSAKAVIYALKKFGFKKIIVLVRNEKKIKKISEYDKKITGMSLKKINSLIPKTDLLVNTTPANSKIEQLINLNNTKRTVLVSDINYIPHQTKLLKKAEKLKLKTLYGVDMLLLQAVPSFKQWFGFSPKINKLIKNKCLKKIIK
ncbi:MAG: Shikimate dehydrogenase (NADP(+)) [Alphaproteobacteria bacterium MarineAlpha5_Bin11]|nr:hypothetical protein [Pelagibacteraceae bacterium]PPR44903.1 MAG: Shikimate dehydrogenase (NADP(+)) [Alphaproteobacteria bacterium MarineAlpha5_Bin11]PPR51841.1 MAG: Shikimate dehydrogenase (NADP(+)) [Alphaproteobacteria bacterium MarineAlpha5_Bin10]|tara:strand:- start:1726 stop:2547 length:822 start_codon:yes stop_codon:yes gene_type:complete